MDKFIERQNIAHYIDHLKTETDPIKRATLQRLLAEERPNRQATVTSKSKSRPTYGHFLS